jgi:hypothetical protein
MRIAAGFETDNTLAVWECCAARCGRVEYVRGTDASTVATEAVSGSEPGAGRRWMVDEVGVEVSAVTETDGAAAVTGVASRLR